MSSLIEDLKTPQNSLAGFIQVALRVLNYLPSVVSERRDARGYEILISRHAGTERFARPTRKKLFIANPDELEHRFCLFENVLALIANDGTVPDNAGDIIDQVAYTIPQSFGIGLDLLGESNSNRKHIGNRFEEFTRLVVSATGVTTEKIVFKIPYRTDEGENMYSCETDMVLSSATAIASSQENIAADEIVVSLKTSSKDRMGKIFLDKLLMEKFAGHPVKVIGIFHNDVQRKQQEHISHTFVSGLFMVYTKFLCSLEGVYFLDPPPITEREPYCRHISPFSKLLLRDMKELLSS